jgi:hypothetical protein
MKISKINYGSAVFFGAVALLMSLLYGTLLWGMKDAILQQSGAQVTAVLCFLQLPLIGGIIVYAMTLILIAVYNLIAKIYPIAWEVKK